MNPFDEWHSMRGYATGLYNKSGTLSAGASTVRLTTAGWWALSADVDYYWRGPDATSTAVSTADSFEYKKDWAVFKADANDKVSMRRAGSVSGTYRIKYVKGP